MTKRKKKMFKCPLCGFLSWASRLETSHYPLELVEVKSDGRGLIKHIFFNWDTQNPLHSMFQRHFYEVLDYLLIHRYIDAGIVKELAELYVKDVKAPDVFQPDVIFKPGDVNVIYKPKVVE